MARQEKVLRRQESPALCLKEGIRSTQNVNLIANAREESMRLERLRWIAVFMKAG